MYNTIIIEDDPMVMSINCEHLRKCDGIRIAQTFKNGKEAIKYIESGNPVDLIILDIYMPEMNGIEFLEKLRAMGNSCYVIPVTAANERENVEKIVKHNVFDYLVKPFGEKRLQQAIQKFTSYMDIVKENPIVSQSELDKIFNPFTKKTKITEKAEKTIDPRTLDIISEYMMSNKGKTLPIKDIATAVKLTSVTVRRYLKHMEKEKLVSTKLDYSTGGKPAVLYTYK